MVIFHMRAEEISLYCYNAITIKVLHSSKRSCPHRLRLIFRTCSSARIVPQHVHEVAELGRFLPESPQLLNLSVSKQQLLNVSVKPRQSAETHIRKKNHFIIIIILQHGTHLLLQHEQLSGLQLRQELFIREL